jgi:hypothetical protein
MRLHSSEKGNQLAQNGYLEAEFVATVPVRNQDNFEAQLGYHGPQLTSGYSPTQGNPVAEQMSC